MSGSAAVPLEAIAKTPASGVSSQRQMARRKRLGFTLAGAAMTVMMLMQSWLSPASAMSDEDWDSCARAAELSSDRPIRGCTAVIKAGEQILAQVVAAYNNRGVAFRSSGEFERALEDYDRAIRLMPD